MKRLATCCSNPPGPGRSLFPGRVPTSGSTAAPVPFPVLLGEVEGESEAGSPTAADPVRERPERRDDLPSGPAEEARVEPPLALANPRPLQLERGLSGVERVAVGTPDLPAQKLADQMLRGLCVTQLGSQTALRMELATARLPRVGLDLRIERGRLTARFSVPDPAGRELIRAARGELEDGLGARGIAVASIEVEVEPFPLPGRPGCGAQGRRGGQPDPREGQPRERRGRRFVL